jgi:hypothetical protein
VVVRRDVAGGDAREEGATAELDVLHGLQSDYRGSAKRTTTIDHRPTPILVLVLGRKRHARVGSPRRTCTRSKQMSEK